MKKNKLVFLVIIVFLLSGCTFEYNINISNNIISENNNVYLKGTTSDNVEKTFENIVNKYTGPTNSLGMYSSSIIEKDNLFGVSYKKDYGYIDYNYSVSFSSCYNAYKLIEEDNKLIIATGSEFNCFNKYEELEEVVINLTSEYNIEENNADVVDDDTYTWFITKDNAGNKPINITIDLNKYTRNVSTSDNYGSFFVVVTSIAVIGLIVLIIFIRGKKKNKI